jgi:hypothetical protein
LSAFRDSHPDEHGSFKRRHLEPFLVHDADRVAYLVYGSTGPVGFAFVFGLASDVRRFDQFFIVRSQRRQALVARRQRRPSADIRAVGKSPSRTRTRPPLVSGGAWQRKSAATCTNAFSRCPISRTFRTT